MDKRKNYFNTEEVANEIGVNVITIRRYIHNGKLKASRVGERLFRISKEDFNDFLKKYYPQKQ